MPAPEHITDPSQNAEGLLMRNVDLARQRLMRRGGELESILRANTVLRKEQIQLINYTMCGLDAAHSELRGAVSDLTEFALESQSPEQPDF
jgi:hypothetical protein